MRLPVTLVAAVAQGVRPACHAAMHVWHLRHLQKRHGSSNLSAELLELIAEESNLLSRRSPLNNCADEPFKSETSSS